jgi:hypothetical protein
LLLLSYGSVVGIAFAALLIWISKYMGEQFELLQDAGIKVGDKPDNFNIELANSNQNESEDTSCGLEDEGQILDGSDEEEEKKTAIV